ncbi:pantothenate kinase acetyl-CoA regulated [Eubacterium sp. CAG:841]|nr:pantothenate kinase acetyl-CoA regulated [Eubacterium sp. CAG:841]
MKAIIGIDVGGSTTKIVASYKGKINFPQFVRAADPVTSVYGAFGKFTTQNGLELSDIEKVIITGVGSSYIKKPIYGLPLTKAVEFDCVGRGGLYLSGLSEAIVISMGTGTALVHAKKSPDGITTAYLGGTGVGGGTLIGLSKKMLGMDDIDHIVELAETGELDNVDLRIKDLTEAGASISLPPEMTAANFGKLSDIAAPADIARGIINMVFETVGVMGVFAARKENIENIVLTGNLATIAPANKIFENLSSTFGVNFIIPENAQFATAIGAALGN